MGICGSTTKQPEDQICKLSQPIITSGELQIKVLLKNIKLKMPDIRQCSIEFDLGKCKYTSPVHVNNEGEHYWRASFDGLLKMTEQQMRETNIKISVLTSSVIGQAQINLFEAAVGPFHFEGQNSGNVSFDLKMNQIVQATLQSKYIIWELNSSLNEVRYNYNLRLVTSQLSYISEHSSTFTNPNYRKQNEKKNTQFQTSRKSILDQDSVKDIFTSLSRLPSLKSPPNPSYDSVAATPTHKANHRIEWEHINDELAMIVELPIQEFQGSALQLCLWSISSNKRSLDNVKSPQKTTIKKTKNQHDSEYMDLEIQDHHLVAETYINLSNMETSVSGEQGAKILMIKSYQPKSLWYHGVEVVSESQIISNSPHLGFKQKRELFLPFLLLEMQKTSVFLKQK